MALSGLTEPADIYTDSSGVVQALTGGDVHCIGANHKDADLWTRVWDKIVERSEHGLRLEVARSHAPHLPTPRVPAVAPVGPMVRPGLESGYRHPKCGAYRDEASTGSSWTMFFGDLSAGGRFLPYTQKHILEIHPGIDWAHGLSLIYTDEHTRRGDTFRQTYIVWRIHKLGG